MAITVFKFSKIFRDNMPSDPPRTIFLLNLLQIKFAQKKTCAQKSQNLVPPLKNYEYSADVKHFQRAYSLPGLNVFVFS